MVNDNKKVLPFKVVKNTQKKEKPIKQDNIPKDSNEKEYLGIIGNVSDMMDNFEDESKAEDGDGNDD